MGLKDKFIRKRNKELLEDKFVHKASRILFERATLKAVSNYLDTPIYRRYIIEEYEPEKVLWYKSFSRDKDTDVPRNANYWYWVFSFKLEDMEFICVAQRHIQRKYQEYSVEAELFHSMGNGEFIRLPYPGELPKYFNNELYIKPISLNDVFERHSLITVPHHTEYYTEVGDVSEIPKQLLKSLR